MLVKHVEEIKNTFLINMILCLFQATVEPSGLFMPFQVKENTKLAPECRQYISEEQKSYLDKCLIDQVSN